MFQEVSELSILVAAIVSVAVGSVWYSPLLFGTTWLRGAGLTIADEDVPLREASLVALKGVIAQTIFFVSLAALLPRTELTVLELGLILTVLLLSYMVSVMVWEKRPLAYFLVHAGYGTIALLGGIHVIALWPW